MSEAADDAPPLPSDDLAARASAAAPTPAAPTATSLTVDRLRDLVADHPSGPDVDWARLRSASTIGVSRALAEGLAMVRTRDLASAPLLGLSELGALAAHGGVERLLPPSLMAQITEGRRLEGLLGRDLHLSRTALENARQFTEMLERFAPPQIDTTLLAVEHSAVAALGAVGRLVLEKESLATAWGMSEIVPTKLVQQLGLTAVPDLSQVADQAARLLGMTSGAARYTSEIAALRAVQLERSSAVRAAWAGMEALSAAADRLWAGFAADPDRLARIGPQIAAIAPCEMYGAARAYDVLLDDEDVEEAERPTGDAMLRAGAAPDEAFESRLATLSPALVTMYRGALERAVQGGADSSRHVLISLRELTAEVLRALAPDAAVLADATPDQLDRNGRPTRALRLQYICRGVHDGDLCDFLKADLTAWGKQLDYLNKVHKPDIALSSAQATVVVERLRGMLSAWLLMAER